MTHLTRYPEGSIRELWSISLPLMISTFASLLMIFTDRIFLARYSLSDLNASVTAGTLAWAIMGGLGMVTAMSEVFVAQYNGAKLHSRLGVPVWQMIWFALLSLVLFIPFGIWGSPVIFSTDAEITYFRMLMFFGPSYAILTAFAGFFIGRGQTAIMIWLAVAANVVNIGLDWVLIFGIKGFIPELGIQGAAIATCTGYFFEAAMLAYFFLRKTNREQYGTANWRIDWTEMKKCLAVGFPQGIFCCLEVVGWSVFYWMMMSLSNQHITVSSICQSFTILLSFFCDGLSRGAAAVTGNLIGAGKHDAIAKVLRSGIALVALFSLTTSLFLVIDPQDTVRLLFFDTIDPSMIPALKTCMFCAFAYMFFEGFRWLLSGVLVAAGDTLFLLIAGSLSVWVFLLIPIQVFVVQWNLSVEVAWIITVLYSALLLGAYWMRYKRGAWREKDLIGEEIQNE